MAIEQRCWRIGNVIYDMLTFQLWRPGKQKPSPPLPPDQAQLLNFFITTYPERLKYKTRIQVMLAAWGEQKSGNSLYKSAEKLRKALGDSKKEIIKTGPYRLELEPIPVPCPGLLSSTNQSERSAERPDLFIRNINHLWQPLFEDLRAATKREKRLDILGLTLYAVWGQLVPWIQERETMGWTIDIYCLAPDAARGALASLIPEQWAKDAEDKTRVIRTFLKRYKKDLASRNIRLSIRHYHSFPGVHGYLLGSGKIYMSISHWSSDDATLEYGKHPYEVLEAEDQSPRAKALREVFLGWLERAKKG